jgi:hypothetical protein
MKTTTLSKATAALAVVFGCVTSGFASASYSVDMDLSTPGIQNTRVASPGDVFTVGIVLSVDAAGVSSYGVSALFDTTVLMLNGVTPAANNPSLPGGLHSLAAPTWNNGLGWVHSFNGATLGLGPVSTNFLVGTINFNVLAAFESGSPTITLGFFNAALDGMFDNSGNPVTPVFQSGTVVVSPPRLSVLLTNANSIRVSWRTNYTGFMLQQNSTLGTTNWTPVTNSPAVDGENWRVLISPLMRSDFYRLFKP